MEFKTIRYEEPEPEIGVITLNRPDRLNALNLDMLEELAALFADLGPDDRVRVLIVTGAGRGFCSGADLKDGRVRREANELFASVAAHLIGIQKKYAALISGMRRLPQPIIAAVNGAAAGGGMCVALASDVVIAAPEAVFIPSFINIGLSAGELGTSYLLSKVVGLGRASEILFTGRTVTAEEGERIGLVSRVVKGESLMDEAMNTARIMLGKSPMGLRLTKEALNYNQSAPSLEAALELENRNQSICCFTPEFLEAIEAFGKAK